MIYTTIITLITAIYFAFNGDTPSGFVSNLGTFLYWAPFAVAGGTVAYLIKIHFIENMVFLGSVGDLIWKNLFWSFIAQIVGAGIGIALATSAPGIIFKVILWVVSVIIVVFGFSSDE